MTEDDGNGRPVVPRGGERIKLGNDGLSQLWRERIDLETDTLPAMADTIAALIESFRQLLIKKGWPDPVAEHVWHGGRPTGEVVDDDLTLKVMIGARADVIYRPGWQTVRLRLEGEGHVFSDEWYCARLIGLGMDALQGEGDARDRALVNFGFYHRDWGARSSFGRKALSKLRQEAAAGETGEAAKARRKKAAENPPEWWDDALTSARRHRQREPDLKLWPLAGKVASELADDPTIDRPRKQMQVFRVIKKYFQ